MEMRMQIGMILASALLAVFVATTARGEDPWIVFEGDEGPGKGRHIVLVSGDEEYRSEETIAQLGKILAKHHGFRCTCLFAIDPQTGIINPNVLNNIPGLEALKSADLMVIFTRFRALPDQQMQLIDDYLKAGQPVIGIRTSTHGFRFGGNSKWAHYGNGYRGDKQEWSGGFGRLVMGEKWISHHGHHKHESSRGVLAPEAADHPITRGLTDGDVWGPTDVYGVRLPLPGDSRPIVLGQVMKRKGEFDGKDSLFGMRPDDGPAVKGKNNDPLMPIIWTRTYKVPGGKPGRCLSSTIGASTDLLAEGTRRALVNGAYWCVGIEQDIPEKGTKVDMVGEFKPTAYAAHHDNYWNERKLKPSDFAAQETSGADE